MSEDLKVGMYQTTMAFRAIQKHTCVHAENMTVIAVTGKYGDEDAEKYACLFAIAPQLKKLAEICAMGNTDPDDLQRMAEKILKSLEP